MRRLLRGSREEEFDHVQYLTAKYNQLATEKAVLQRDYLLLAERERSLRTDMETLSARLCQQEHDKTQLELSLRHQQELVEMLQQRLCEVLEESSSEAEQIMAPLQQVNAELLSLQGNEERLEELVEKLQTELQQQLQDVQAQLDRTCELQDLQRCHQMELQDVLQENQMNLRKLKHTAQQFEWFCEQQRVWVNCVKSFKDGVVLEKEMLLQHISHMEAELGELRDAHMREIRGNSGEHKHI